MDRLCLNDDGTAINPGAPCLPGCGCKDSEPKPCQNSCIAPVRPSPASGVHQCAWPPANLSSMLHIQEGVSKDIYNELVLDSNTWVANLPHSIEAVFYPKGCSQATEDRARAAHAALVQRYKTETPLFVLDVSNWQAPFAVAKKERSALHVPNTASVCPSVCGVCPPAGVDGACCYGNQTCETSNWSRETCTSRYGTWCTHMGPPTPPTPRPPPCPPPRGRYSPRHKDRQSASSEETEKQDLFVVLRLDDIQVGYLAQEQATIVDWALQRGVKLNLGVITGSASADAKYVTWPTDCPGSKLCDDPVVAVIRSAYEAGRVRSELKQSFEHEEETGALIELFDHAYHHNSWGEDWPLTSISSTNWSSPQLRCGLPTLTHASVLLCRRGIWRTRIRSMRCWRRVSASSGPRAHWAVTRGTARHHGTTTCTRRARPSTLQGRYAYHRMIRTRRGQASNRYYLLMQSCLSLSRSTPRRPVRRTASSTT